MEILLKRNSYENLRRLMKESYFSRWCNSLKAKIGHSTLPASLHSSIISRRTHWHCEISKARFGEHILILKLRLLFQNATLVKLGWIITNRLQ